MRSPDPDLPPEPSADSPKSKSQRKREHLDLQVLAERLVGINDEQLSRVALDPPLRDTVVAARGLKRGAYRRQLRYLARRLSYLDVEAVRASLAVVLEADAAAGPRLRHLERLREQLISDGDAALETIIDAYPDADRQQLRQLVRGARSELANGSGGRQHRALLRQLREMRRAGAGVPETGDP